LIGWRDRLPPVRGRLQIDAPLAPYTWLRVGGPADALFLPSDEADLASFLKALEPSVPVTVLGVGSNTLVRDGGVEGVVIRLGRGFADIAALDGARIRAGAAALDAQVARAAAQAGIGGLEFYTGVPGAIGGACPKSPRAGKPPSRSARRRAARPSRTHPVTAPGNWWTRPAGAAGPMAAPCSRPCTPTS
jgi:hypothetical protein